MALPNVLLLKIYCAQFGEAFATRTKRKLHRSIFDQFQVGKNGSRSLLGANADGSVFRELERLLFSAKLDIR